MTQDHRPAVAAQRREKMRKRLIEATALVIAAKGLDRVVIDDIIGEAGVSRGTFYKYFDTVTEAMNTTRIMLGEELFRLVIATDRDKSDIAVLLAQDVLRFFATATKYPLLGQFAAKLGFSGLGKGNVLHEIVPEYLEQGIQSGRFCEISPIIAIDMLQLGTVAMLKRHAEGEIINPHEAVAAMLRMLGVPREEAMHLASIKASALKAPEDSLISRSNAIWEAQQAASAAKSPDSP
jgi:AcrR family transcriptional regulator